MVRIPNLSHARLQDVLHAMYFGYPYRMQDYTERDPLGYPTEPGWTFQTDSPNLVCMPIK